MNAEKPREGRIWPSLLMGLALYAMLLAVLILGRSMGASKFIYVDF